MAYAPAQVPRNSSVIVVAKSSPGAVPTVEEQRFAQSFLGGGGNFQGARVGDVVGSSRIVGITPQGGVIVQPASAPYTPIGQVSQAPVVLQPVVETLSTPVVNKQFLFKSPSLQQPTNRLGYSKQVETRTSVLPTQPISKIESTSSVFGIYPVIGRKVSLGTLSLSGQKDVAEFIKSDEGFKATQQYNLYASEASKKQSTEAQSRKEGFGVFGFLQANYINLLEGLPGGRLEPTYELSSAKIAQAKIASDFVSKGYSTPEALRYAKGISSVALSSEAGAVATQVASIEVVSELGGGVLVKRIAGTRFKKLSPLGLAPFGAFEGYTSVESAGEARLTPATFDEKLFGAGAGVIVSTGFGYLTLPKSIGGVLSSSGAKKAGAIGQAIDFPFEGLGDQFAGSIRSSLKGTRLGEFFSPLRLPSEEVVSKSRSGGINILGNVYAQQTNIYQGGDFVSPTARSQSINVSFKDISGGSTQQKNNEDFFGLNQRGRISPFIGTTTKTKQKQPGLINLQGTGLVSPSTTKQFNLVTVQTKSISPSIATFNKPYDITVPTQPGITVPGITDLVVPSKQTGITYSSFTDTKALTNTFAQSYAFTLTQEKAQTITPTNVFGAPGLPFPPLFPPIGGGTGRGGRQAKRYLNEIAELVSYVQPKYFSPKIGKFKQRMVKKNPYGKFLKGIL